MNFIRWIGTLASIVGSFVVASKVFVLGYCLFMLGSVCWLWVGIRSRDVALCVLNGTFLCANILGLYNAL